MSAAILVWLFFRNVKWLLWFATVAYYIELVMHRPNHLNSFGHLLHSTEFGYLAFPWRPFLLDSLN
jgi:hypothetical protein